MYSKTCLSKYKLMTKLNGKYMFRNNLYDISMTSFDLFLVDLLV